MTENNFLQKQIRPTGSWRRISAFLFAPALQQIVAGSVCVRPVVAALLALAAVVAAPFAAARPVTDCPPRDIPFSTASPLIDIMLSPAAKAVVNREAPDLLRGFPPQLVGDTPPTLASVITLHEIAGFRGKAPESVDYLNRPLAAVPVTAADRLARCRRYDNDRPNFIVPATRPKLLMFEKITGFRDGPSVDAAHAAFLDMAREKGWSIVSTDRGGAIRPSILARFDAVIWNNISGDVLTFAQRRALKSYVEHGGGFLAIHGSGGDPNYLWNWYRDTLIGARFIGHPFAPQFQSARIVTDDPANPLAKGLPSEWTMNDEWYSFAQSPRASGAHVLARLDETTYSPFAVGKRDLRMGDHPIAWTHCVGKGHSFYSAIGHRPETYADPNYRIMLENAVAWATAPGNHACVSSGSAK